MPDEKEKPQWSPTLYAIWAPAGGPEGLGHWWQSDAGDYGDGPVVLFTLDHARNYALSESAAFNEGEFLHIYDVSDWTNPTLVEMCRCGEDEDDLQARRAS